MIRPAAGLMAIAIIESLEFAERGVALPDAVARGAAGSAGGLGEEEGERKEDQEALYLQVGRVQFCGCPFWPLGAARLLH